MREISGGKNEEEEEGWRELGLLEINLGEKVKDDRKRLQKRVTPYRPDTKSTWTYLEHDYSNQDSGTIWIQRVSGKIFLILVLLF